MIPLEKTTDDFIKALFDKRTFTDDIDGLVRAHSAGYRLAKAFDSIKFTDIQWGEVEGLTLLESFTKGYREALK